MINKKTMIPLRSTTYFKRNNDFISFYDSSQIGILSTFSELENTDFKREMNALCWHLYHVDCSPIAADTFYVLNTERQLILLPMNKRSKKSRFNIRIQFKSSRSKTRLKTQIYNNLKRLFQFFSGH